MKTVLISKKARSANALLEEAKTQNLIVRAADGTEFILAEIDDFNREIELTRQNKKLMKLLDSRAKQTETVSLEDARKLLGLE
ncbi:MAG: hypothetical protein AB7P14_29505 [Blastocatellales bacterium]